MSVRSDVAVIAVGSGAGNVSAAVVAVPAVAVVVVGDAADVDAGVSVWEYGQATRWVGSAAVAAAVAVVSGVCAGGEEEHGEAAE